MKIVLISVVIFSIINKTYQEEVRLIDLDPQDAQQIIEQQDTSLNYAPKVESNVPAVRYIGNEPKNVIEDIYLANQYHGQDGVGGYVYGYSVPDIAKTEKKKAGGDLRGAYNYIAGNGQEIKVEYWDDGTGFHQVDNVPKALPEDLPEVKKAKEDFLRLWQEEAERNSHPVQDPYDSEGQYKEGPLSVQGQKHRQQQFQAQFGGNYQPAESQQKSIYQSNLEKTNYNPSYQAYQGKDQQNQGVYESKQYGGKGNQWNQPQNPQAGQTGNQWNQPQNPQAGQTGNQWNQPQNPHSGQTGNQWNQPKNPQAGQSGNQWNQPQNPQAGQSGHQWNQPQNTQGAQGTNQWNKPQGAIQTGNQWNKPKYPTETQGEYSTQYQGQQTQNVNQYAQNPQSSYGQKGQEDDGEYHPSPEEQQGPPKGFFYKFDYPVGIIVSKDGGHQGKQPGIY